MKKNRKTRKQKIRSDSRKTLRVNPVVEAQTPTEEEHTRVIHSLTGIALPRFTTSSPSDDKTRYAYVLHDVRNTFTILGIIMAANILLYVLIQQGVIKIAW